jgi:hypothetical protein
MSKRTEGTTAGAQFLEIIRLGFKSLFVAYDSYAIGDTRYKRCPDERLNYRNSYSSRLLNTRMGDLWLDIPNIRLKIFGQDSRQAADVYSSIRLGDGRVHQWHNHRLGRFYGGGAVRRQHLRLERSRICAGLNKRVKTIQKKLLGHVRGPFLSLDSMNHQGHLERNLQV